MDSVRKTPIILLRLQHVDTCLGVAMRQLSACTLVLLFLANAASAASVTWLSDSRSLQVWSNEYLLASPDFGTTAWNTALNAGNAYANQNTTIGTTSGFGGTGSVEMDGMTDQSSSSRFGVTFRVSGGGTTLDLTGDYGGYSQCCGMPGGTVVFQLKQGDTSIYLASGGPSGGLINYSGFLTDGDYELTVQAFINTGGFNGGGAAFDFTGEFGTSTVTFVPIPAAAWLFGSALAGLGWLKRKRLA